MLQGCGFHLRGFVDMPAWLNRVDVIVENAHRELRPILIESLHSYHISTCDITSDANYLLIVDKDEYKESISSVSSSTTSRQYELTYIVYFKLISSKGVELIIPTYVTITRQITTNNDRILGSNQEEELIKGEMRREAALQMLFRISRMSKQAK